MPRLWIARVVVGAAVVLAAACSFEPSGAVAVDAATDTAELDGPTIDALDGSIDAQDASPDALDACVPGPELCNGVDDNCNGMIDEAFPTLGTACDGPDSDMCPDDVMVCAASGVGTTCATGDDDLETCNGMDDDCDGTIDDGFPGVGMACDGADTDVCVEGMLMCSVDGASVVCSDVTSSTVETCNSMNDDCDATTDEGFDVGMPCDGTDGDACVEGTIECDPGTGGTRCNDNTGTQIEQCNNADDDCDTMMDEGFDLTSDPLNCGLCGRVCANNFGTTSCATSACVPTCSAGANDCDGNPVTGCELRDTNPACASAGALGSGSVIGDVGAATLTGSGYGEAVYTVLVRETAGGDIPVRAEVTLTSPPGTNFDLEVTCASCAGTPLSSNNLTGDDVVAVRRNDRNGINDDYTIIVTVRWTSSSACGTWALTVAGNAGTTVAQTCAP